MSGEYDFEPVPGLPEDLPEGETLLWQGAPDWKTLAGKAFHVRGLAIYFAVLLTWYATSQLNSGADGASVLTASLRLGALSAGAVILVVLYAWLSAKTTLYTVTNRRVVIRSGVALPMMLNLPFAKIEAADLRTYGDGAGDIALTLPLRERVAYLMLWPHVQPWRLARARPMLRAVPRVGQVVEILGQALSAAEPTAANAEARRDRAPGRAAAHRPSPHATALA